MYITIFILASIIFLGLYLLIRFNKKKYLPKSKKKLFFDKLYIISKIPSKKESIIDYDKLYHNLLKELAYNGTFGDILKSKPKEIKNINTIWELHKLRNKLVHEFISFEDKFLESKSIEYKKEIERLLYTV